MERVREIKREAEMEWRGREGEREKLINTEMDK